MGGARMISNVRRLRDSEPADGAVGRPLTVGGSESLSAGWRSVTLGLEKLQVHLDNLKLVLDALPDGADEASVKILRDTIENQIRDSLTWSIAMSMVIARIEARQADE
jgi:hypothetical protein